MTDVCFVADMGSQNPVDFAKLKAAEYQTHKCEGVILRAQRSNGEIDAQFQPRCEAAMPLGFLPGAYAFNTGETAKAQADRFAGVTRPFAKLLRALDFETYPQGGNMSFDAALEFMERTDQTFGVATWMYSGNRLKELVIHATDAQRTFLDKHPLWGCEYGPKWRNVDVNGHTLPMTMQLWQFTDGSVGPQPHTFNGLEAHADVSIFQGTREQLEAIWYGAPLVAPAAAVTAQMAPVEQTSVLDHLETVVGRWV
jgi:lysozyme